jgi:hypothetical protein
VVLRRGAEFGVSPTEAETRLRRSACHDDLIAVPLSAATCLLIVIRHSTGEVLVKYELTKILSVRVAECGGVASHPNSGEAAVAFT